MLYEPEIRTLSSVISNGKERKRVYNQRVIDIEHGLFNPLAFTLHGGGGKEAERFIIALSNKLSEKKNIQRSQTVNWLRTKLSSHLTRSAVLCIEGSRSIKSNVTRDLTAIVDPKTEVILTA